MTIKRYHYSLSGIMVEAADGDYARFTDANDLLSLNAELLEALISARAVIVTALKSSAPDWFETDADIASHHTIKKIDAAIAKSRSQS